MSDKLISGVVIKCSETSISVAFEEVPDEIHLSGHEGHLQLVRLANDVTYRRLKRLRHFLTLYYLHRVMPSLELLMI